ncbi:MAG: tyrosine transporter [Chlamydiales bacterium]|nr:hypothetical protein [Chlamydiales bacterium]NCF71045.1 tyrosine transporter [Chlamydiales bacterium]
MPHNPFHKIKSFLGGALLIAGSCIGAAMLALPLRAGFAGYIPSSIVFIVCWIFMLITALMLAEVNIYTGRGSSLISMAGATLGEWGKAASWGIFLCLFYALMVAYSFESGLLISGQLEMSYGIQFPAHWGSCLFVSLMGFFIYLGTQAVDKANRALMLVLIFCYFFLVFTGTRFVSSELLTKTCSPKHSFLVLPVMVTSFGFHNVIPSISEHYQYDRKRIRKAILFGGSIPLLIYLVWNAIILGIIPFEEEHIAFQALQGKTPAQALMAVAGNQKVLLFANGFAFFAIATSFIGVGLSLVDFLADGLKIKKEGASRAVLCIVALLPPLLFSMGWENLFLKSLEYVGGFMAVILFGFFPVLMLNKLKKAKDSESLIDVVISSKLTKGYVISFSTLVFIIQLLKELHFLNA